MNYNEYERLRVSLRKAQQEEKIRSKTVQDCLKEAYFEQMDKIKQQFRTSSFELKKKLDLQIAAEKAKHRTAMDKFEMQIQRLSYEMRKEEE